MKRKRILERRCTDAVSRRRFLSALVMSATATSSAPYILLGSDSPFVSFDREIEQFMQARKVPGAALAVVKDRRLVYARGYGLGDREKREMARATSLFRIASISKPITAVAVLKLVEHGKLDLDARVWDCLDLRSWIPVGKKTDERWRQITLRQLLQHTGGWDRDKSFDPMFRSRMIAKELGVASPPAPRDIIRYMLGQPLDFDPGTRYAYSNFGYCLLGRVIETFAGLDYEKSVQQDVLAPLGIRRMRIGRSLAEHQVKDEVRYYLPQEETAGSVFDTTQGKVPWPYGGFCLESMDAHGGWIASAVDLARFAAAFHDPARCPLLKQATIQNMYAPPSPPASRNDDGSLEDSYYGCGWLVRPVGKGGRANYWHTGSLPGTHTLLVRRHDGLSWAVLFNQRSNDKNLPYSAIDSALHRAADAVKEWPGEDLFPKYLRGEL
jgi:CubicO group peptidase (beta-lactamase class C family)